MATLRAMQRQAPVALDFGRPVSKGKLAPSKSAAAKADPEEVLEFPLPPKAERKEEKRERDRGNELLGKKDGSVSNSIAPKGDMLHPTDRAVFDARARNLKRTGRRK